MPTPGPEPSPSTRRTASFAVRRRLTAVLGTAAALVLTTGPGAFAEPAPAPSAGTSASATNPNLGPATPGTALCTVSNTNLDEVTGMVATAQGIYAVEGGDTFDPNSVQIWTIDATSCQASSKNHGFDPADPQDLALGTDGALWVADTGDGIGDDNQRDWVTLERVDPAGSTQAVPHRTQYPTTGKINALAVLLQKDNTPIVIANGGGKGVLYRPDGPLQAGASSGLPILTKVGEFTPTKTGTANPLGTFGNALVTGAATSPDRTRVVIRTTSDAYEFKVGEDGDIVTAITGGTAAITPLPDEENGQAISYSADGKSFLTLGSVDKPVLRSYTPFVVTAPSSNAGPPAAEGSAGLSFSDITNIAAAAGFVGFLAVVAGVIGIYRARRQYRERGEWAEGDPAYARTGPREARGGRGAGDRGGRDRRDARGGDGRGRPVRPDRRGEGEYQQYGDDGQERVPRPRSRPGRADVWAPANVQGDPGRGPHGGREEHIDRGQRHGGPPPGPSHGQPAGPSYVPPPVHSQAPPPSQPQVKPPPGPASGRATPPRPRPASGGQVYGRPRQDPDGGNDPSRRGGYGHDNIDH